jgi:hypothetical protein
MKGIRDLLMDCRIELRTLVRDFQKTDLCKRIDDARDALLHGPAAAAANDAISVEGADRVAQAWQGAAEDLKLIAPAFYDLLAKKVAQRLAALPPLMDAPVAAVASEGVKDEAAVTETPNPSLSVAASVAAAPTVAEVAASINGAVHLDIDSHIPNEEMLMAIVANKRRFTETQREWCVGEAMVRSGFTIDPEEFIARGDNEMARYILESVSE